MKYLQHLESNSLLLALGRRDMIPRSFNRRVIGGGKDAADWRQLPMPSPTSKSVRQASGPGLARVTRAHTGPGHARERPKGGREAR